MSDQQRGLVVDRVADSLRNAILEGELRPGARLRQGQIAKDMGVSMIPVREALLQLQAEGLLVNLPHASARVPVLDANELVEIYQIRERLEPFAMSLSAPRLADETIRALRHHVDEMEFAAAQRDIGRWVSVDRRFHLLALSEAPARVCRIVESLWNASQHYRRTYLVAPERLSRAAHDHRLLLRAVETHDADDAELICLMHIRRTRKTLLASGGLTNSGTATDRTSDAN